MKQITFLLAILISLFASATLFAGDAVTKTVAAVYQEKSQLKGKQVTVNGKVVKVNNAIMKRNFVHIDDGTAAGADAKLIVTSNQTAKVGDNVSITGTVVLDTDFGYGYAYPLLVEKATIQIK